MVMLQAPEVLLDTHSRVITLNGSPADRFDSSSFRAIGHDKYANRRQCIRKLAMARRRLVVRAADTVTYAVEGAASVVVRIANDANRAQSRARRRRCPYGHEVSAEIVLPSNVDHLYIRSVNERASNQGFEQVHFVFAFDQQKEVRANHEITPLGCGMYRHYRISKLISRAPSSVSPVNVMTSTLPATPFLNSLCMDKSSGASAKAAIAASRHSAL